MNALTSFRLAALAAVASLVLLLVPRPSFGAEPYDIYTVLSLTGSAAFLGKGEAQALAAVEAIENARGGIHGRKVHFVVLDDQSDPAVAVQLTNGVKAKGVPVVLGSSVVSVCNAMFSSVRAAGPVHYCFSPGFQPVPGSYGFSSSISTHDLTDMGLRYLQARGWKRFALIVTTDATGQEAEAHVHAALAQPAYKALDLVAAEHFSVTDLSVSAQIQRLLAAKPDIIVAITNGTAFGTVLHGVADAGVDIPLLGGFGNLIYGEMDQYAKFLPRRLYFFGVQFFRDPSTVGEPLRSQIAAFRKAFAPAKADLGQGLAWDAAGIVVDALRRLPENVTADGLRDYLIHSHGYVGIHGVYDFRSGDNRGLTPQSALMLRYDKTQKLFVPVSKPGGAPLPGGG